MPKFRWKNPVVVEARQIGDVEEIPRITEWCGGLYFVENEGDERIYIKTSHGSLVARIGDWIIKGVNGEFYPCKDDIFQKTYEPVLMESAPDADIDFDPDDYPLR